MIKRITEPESLPEKINEIIDWCNQFSTTITAAEIEQKLNIANVGGSLTPFGEAINLLRDLADIQNGPPLVTYEKEWNEIMEKVYAFLNEHERQ